MNRNRVGDVVLIARRAQGMTQEELAQRLGVKQAALSRYENNLRVPEPEMLTRLAAALSVTVDFLTHHFEMQGALAADTHMRRQKSAKVADWRMGEARLNLYRMRSSFLLERIGVTTQNQVPVFDPDDTSPADAAQLLREQWRMPIGPVRNLTGWLESAGIIVLEEDFGTHRIDGMSQWAGTYPVMTVNIGHTPDRRRMTLAHELGHLVLHSTYPSRTAEQDANDFAAELLMPEHIVSRDLKTKDLTTARLIDLKAVWGVSIQVLYERAYQFHMVSSEARQKFYRYLNSKGWKRNEPYPEVVTEERPELAASVVEELRARGLDMTEIASLTGMSEASAGDPLVPTGQGLRVVR